jgi:hypothetical protein
MSIRLLLPVLAAAALVSGCSTYDEGGPRYAGYDYNRPDPSYGGYDAGRYYHEDPRAQAHRIEASERVYRGQDGRYYCRRSNGTTGLIVGALAGGLLGNALAPGGSETLGTLLGAGGGAVIGSEVDRNSSCR